MKPSHVLVVDDDHNLRETLCDLLTDAGYQVSGAPNGLAALSLLNEIETDLVLCDWRMPDMGGEAFLRRMGAERERQATPVLIMTAFGSGPSAMQAMQLGAYDFLTKPLDRDVVLSTIRRALRHVELQREVDALRSLRFADLERSPEPHTGAATATAPARLVGHSPAWINVFKDVGRVAGTQMGVLLLGESGTGKEVVARAIHEHSPRKGKPFVIVNCAALPPELLESELFGHERGAFTGAVQQKRGKFEAANGGTVFLDEIGELPMALQPKLLRVLQEHTFERIGSNRQEATDVRVIAATNRNLEQEVTAKYFRADLYYRLNTFTIKLPPLRDRKTDIQPLAEYFLERHAQRNGTVPQGLTEEASQLLQRYEFPGNVRELEHLIERCAVQAAGRAITAEEVSREWQPAAGTSQDLRIDDLLQLPFYDAIFALERKLLQQALALAGGNRSEAARQLGVNRRLIYEKLAQHKLE